MLPPIEMIMRFEIINIWRKVYLNKVFSIIILSEIPQCWLTSCRQRMSTLVKHIQCLTKFYLNKAITLF